MRQIVIASHGYMARGMESTLALLTGETCQIEYMCGYVDEENIKSRIQAFFQNLSQDTEVIIFTDLMGGSVNAEFIPYLSSAPVHLIAGFNLGLILEIMTAGEERLTEEFIREAVRKARQGIVYVNDCQVCYDPQDDV